MKGAVYVLLFLFNLPNFILNFCQVKTCYRLIFLVLFLKIKCE